MLYRISDQAAPLCALVITNVDAEVIASHPTMQAKVRRACEARNAVIALLMGTGDYAVDWQAPDLDENGAPLALPYDPDAAMPLLDSLCIEIRSHQSPMTQLDAELVRDRVRRIIVLDKEHPVAKHWQVLRAATYGTADEIPAWPDVEMTLADVTMP